MCGSTPKVSSLASTQFVGFCWITNGVHIALDNPDKLVVHAYTVLTKELLYIAINTVPQLSYSMSCLTCYMSKVTPTHLQMQKLCYAI